MLSKFDCAARPSGRESEAIDLQGIRSRVLIVLSLNMSQCGITYKLNIPSVALLLLLLPLLLMLLLLLLLLLLPLLLVSAKQRLLLTFSRAAHNCF